MSDGEVKIHVSADTDLKAIDEAERKLDDLGKRKSPPPEIHSAQPSPRPPSAQPSPRPPSGVAPAGRAGISQTATEANPPDPKVPREFRKFTDEELAARRAAVPQTEREVLRDVREREKAEKAVTREIREQTAEQKAGVRASGRRAAQAVGMGEQMLSGGNPAADLLQTAASSGNPVVMVAAAVAAVGATIATVIAKEHDKDTAQRLELAERRSGEAYDLKHISGVYGSAGALMGTKHEAAKDEAQRTAAQPGLAEKAREKWHDPSTWEFFGLRKNAGSREQEMNEENRIAAGARETSAQKRAAARYSQVEGGLELDTLRHRSNRTLEGQRGAFTNELAGKGLSKYLEAKKQGAPEEMAKEMATLTYENKLRDMQAQAGAGLVSARSGGADIAAAARWAAQSTPQAADIGGKMDTLIGVVNRGNNDTQTVNHAK